MARKAITDPTSDAVGDAPGMSDTEPSGALSTASDAADTRPGAADPVASGDVSDAGADPVTSEGEAGAGFAPETAAPRSVQDAAPWTPRALAGAGLADTAPPSADQIERDSLAAAPAAGSPSQAAPVSATEASPVPRRSALPMLLAGVVTAGLGLGAGWAIWAPGGPLSGAPALEQRLAALEGRLTQAESAVTAAGQSASAVSALLTPLDDRIGAAETSVQSLQGLAGALEALQSVSGQQAAALTVLEQKLTDLAQRPPESDPAAVAAYERELAALRQTFSAELTAIRTSSDQALEEIRSALSAGLTELEESSQEAAALAREAEAVQANAQLAAALASVSAAIDAGTALEGPLAELAALNPGLPLDGFAALRDGVPSLLALQEAFPPAAREALAADIAAGTGEGGFAGTLKSFFGVRSLAPQDGTSTDAVLSRAEAALSAGDLAASLSALDQLASAPAARMQAWRDLAGQRLAALAAFTTLSDAVEK